MDELKREVGTAAALRGEPWYPWYLYYEWASHVGPALTLRATEADTLYPFLPAQSPELEVSGLESGD